MGKKAKAAAATKATAKAQKKAKQNKLADKKANKVAKKQNPKGKKEEEEEDLTVVLERFRLEWEAKHEVFEEKQSGPPSRRANATFTPCPLGSDLWLFGGEYFDGDKCFFYADMYKYSPDKNEWRTYSSQNQPGPRSAHQVAPSPANGGQLWLFGGEFASTKQTSFHHYRDLWVFHVATHSWDRIETKVKPSARSGHRMAMWKNYLVLFGGFIDTGARTTYLDDLWIFDTSEYKWKEIKQNDLRRPGARSGFSFLPCPEGLVLHGGYCKRYVKGQRTQGVALEDTWLLKMDEDLTKLDWVKRRKIGYAPSARSGCTMALWGAKSMGVLFGGVFDDDQNEETLESTFYKDLFGYQLLGTGRWVSLNLKRPKKKAGGGKRKKKAPPAPAPKQQIYYDHDSDEGDEGDGDSDAEGKDEDDDAEKARGDEGQKAASEAVESAKATLPPTPPPTLPDEDDDPNDPMKTVPIERYNTMLAVQRNTLYIYGGIFENANREYTLDSFHTLDLSKMERFVCLKDCPIDALEWNESDDEEGGSDDEDGSSSSGDDEDEEEGGPQEGVEAPEEEEEGEAEGDEAEGKVDKRTQAEKDELRKRATAFLGVSKDTTRSEADVLSTPAPGETLRTFYERSKQYWAATAHEHSDNRGKMLRRDGFALAEKRYDEYKPILEEIERIQQEAGLDDEELKNSSKSGGIAGGGPGMDSRNRR